MSAPHATVGARGESRRSDALRLGLTAACFGGAFAFWAESVIRDAAARDLATAIYGVVILLYAGLCVTALRRRPESPQVAAFVAVGIAVVLTIVWPVPDFSRVPSLGAYWQLLLFSLVYSLPVATFIHLAALIPRRHPIVVRHPAFIPGAYLIAGLTALASFLVYVNLGFSFLPWPWDVNQAIGFDAFINNLSYAFLGVACLVLLGSAARGDPDPEGRRQALVVFLGFLPWTINQVGTLLLPSAIGLLPGRAYVGPAAILLVATSFFIAIAGFQLFDIGLILRKSLIYGLTMAILATSGFLIIAAMGVLMTGVVGIEPNIWELSLLLAAIGAAFQPLAGRMAREVDRLFYREKLALRNLLRTVIPELARFTGLEQVGTHLVRRLTESLGVRTAALVVADEGEHFYRVRSLAGEFASPRAAVDVVLTREDLDRCWSPGLRRPFDRTTRGAPAERPELQRMLDILEARYILPIEYGGTLIGVLTLGAVRSGTEFDREDLQQMELLAQAASAMLENARLFGLATNDSLTGLPHRRVFDDRLVLELSRARREFRAFTIGLIDIDGFKAINDNHGHLVGDQVLRSVAVALSEECRNIDLLARFGGDEMAIILPVTDGVGAWHFGEKMRRAIETVELPAGAPQTAPVTLSIGFYVVRPDDLQREPEDLLRRADAALYTAKRGGRNRVHVDAPPRASAHAEPA